MTALRTAAQALVDTVDMYGECPFCGSLEDEHQNVCPGVPLRTALAARPVSPGYPNPDEVAKACQGAMRAVALGQAVAVDHARVLLAALAFCEQTIDEYAALICELTPTPLAAVVDELFEGPQ